MARTLLRQSNVRAARPFRTSNRFLLTCALTLLLIAGCTAPGLRIGIPGTVETVQSAEHFQLRLAALSAARLADGAAARRPMGPKRAPPLLVLIDGDGQAFLSRTRIAADPTPRRSWLARALPALSAVIETRYLGRPCYWQTDDARCHPRYWTSHRYGRAVRTSMAAALESQGERSLVLAGYSGGGYLAAALAQALPERVVGLITIAAPLDPDAWTRHHGYTPLLEAPPQRPDRLALGAACQRHLHGTRDRELPPALTLGHRGALPSTLIAVPADHDCCWAKALKQAVVDLLESCDF